MKNTQIVLIAFFFCMLSVTGCIPNNDVSQNLSGGYLYRDEGGDMKEILGSKDNEIYGRILSYDFNDDFIVANQKPSYEDYKDMVGFYLRDSISKSSKDSVNEINEGERLADSILKTNPYYLKIFQNHINYWIISHKEDKLYGPLDLKTYKETKIKLGVPSSLRLEKEQ